MRNLLKIFFIVFVFLGCANDNTSVNNIVKYKGTYTGNNITYNESAAKYTATIIVEESGKVTLEIRGIMKLLIFMQMLILLKNYQVLSLKLIV